MRWPSTRDATGFDRPDEEKPYAGYDTPCSSPILFRELAGTALEQFHHLDTFWFAWSTYQPETDLVDD
jgi:hypothetical protein